MHRSPLVVVVVAGALGVVFAIVTAWLVRHAGAPDREPKARVRKIREAKPKKAKPIILVQLEPATEPRPVARTAETKPPEESKPPDEPKPAEVEGEPEETLIQNLKTFTEF